MELSTSEEEESKSSSSLEFKSLATKFFMKSMMKGALSRAQSSVGAKMLVQQLKEKSYQETWVMQRLALLIIFRQDYPLQHVLHSSLLMLISKMVATYVRDKRSVEKMLERYWVRFA